MTCVHSYQLTTYLVQSKDIEKFTREDQRGQSARLQRARAEGGSALLHSSAMAKPETLATEAANSTTGLANLLPAIAWLRAYRKQWLPPDIVAGLTAAAVVVPKATRPA